uniref:4-amino-6-deoxy-N-Acetyl-D-hexosaminyl-(Lipid carrier) acetyltrasferase n=1 Tax=Rheinheimera sp. BAL341 TaxID=1708203 RepID=A0A486XYC2_9GAMM
MHDSRSIIIVGTGGHAKVVLDMVNSMGLHCIAATTADQLITAWRNLPVITDEQLLADYLPTDVELVMGLGFIPGNNTRQQLYDFFKSKGFNFKTLCHPTACISPSAQLAEGVQVMAGVIIQADAHCADNVIINTGARIDHDTCIGAHSHVAPGAVLCGGVNVGRCVFIGAAATVIQSVTIGDDAVLAAGATIVTDVITGKTVRGCPAR